MKNLLILFVCLCTTCITAQELSRLDLKRLERLEMIYAFNSATESNHPITDFRSIIKLDKGIGTRQISGDMLRTIGLIPLVLGTIIVIARDRNSSSDSHDWAEVVGYTGISFGAVTYGASIPLKLGAKKKRKKRDLLIKNMNDKYNQL